MRVVLVVLRQYSLTRSLGVLGAFPWPWPAGSVLPVENQPLSLVLPPLRWTVCPAGDERRPVFLNSLKWRLETSNCGWIISGNLVSSSFFWYVSHSLILRDLQVVTGTERIHNLESFFANVIINEKKPNNLDLDFPIHHFHKCLFLDDGRTRENQCIEHKTPHRKHPGPQGFKPGTFLLSGNCADD